MSTNLREIIRDNVRTLLDVPPGKSGVAKLMEKGFANGTAQRILSAETSIGVDVLADLARKLGVEPWQLCVPGLDPERRPTLEPVTFRWPFHNIDPESIMDLVGVPAQNVENGLLAALAALGISPRKRLRAGA